jgi:hypothetical protein
MYAQKGLRKKMSAMWITVLHLQPDNKSCPGFEYADYENEYDRAIADYTKFQHKTSR